MTTDWLITRIIAYQKLYQALESNSSGRSALSLRTTAESQKHGRVQQRKGQVKNDLSIRTDQQELRFTGSLTGGAKFFATGD